MRFPVIFCLLALVFLALAPHESLAKKKTKRPKKKDAPASSGGFNSKTLKCLICRSVVFEYEAAIFKVDPKKVVDSGSHRLRPDGTKGTVKIPYARSQGHLMELSEKICENMEDYAQATWKKSGKPTLIRMVNPDGNMNPNFSKVDVVKDDDLNSSLKFHCETIVEDNEDDLFKVLSTENPDAVDNFCTESTKLCPSLAKDEL